MTTAVCDSGPLTHLWQIGLPVLFGTFEVLHIAEQVVTEVQRHVPLEQVAILYRVSRRPRVSRKASTSSNVL